MNGIKQDNLQLLERSFSILDYISRMDRPCSLKEVTEATEISKPSVHRILSTLTSNLLLVKDEHARYRMGPKMLQWARACKGNSELLTVSAPYMERIWDASGETIHLVSYENGHAYYLRKKESRYPLQMYSRVGDKLLLHATAAGKAILFSLPEEEFAGYMNKAPLERRTPHTITEPERFYEQRKRFMEKGFCEEKQENELDIRCIASAVLNSDGYPLGAVSITCPVYRCDDGRAVQLGHLLASVIPELSRKFGYSGYMGK